jgi:hypothetical protein
MKIRLTKLSRGLVIHAKRRGRGQELKWWWQAEETVVA